MCGRTDGLHATVFHMAYAEKESDGYTPCGQTGHGIATACFRQAGHPMPSCVLPDPDGITEQNPSGLLEVGAWPVSSPAGS